MRAAARPADCHEFVGAELAEDRLHVLDCLRDRAPVLRRRRPVARPGVHDRPEFSPSSSLDERPIPHGAARCAVMEEERKAIGRSVRQNLELTSVRQIEPQLAIRANHG